MHRFTACLLLLPERAEERVVFDMFFRSISFARDYTGPLPSTARPCLTHLRRTV